MSSRALNLAFLFSCLGVFVFFLGCENNDPLTVVSVDQVYRDSGLIKLIESKGLYSGYLVDHYKNAETNSLKSRSLVKEGKLNGLSEGWYSGGQLQVSETFIEGRSHGARVKWYSNGQKKADDSIKNGELQGLCRKWHDNGLLSEEMTMVDGKAHGKARSWHEDGSLKADVLLDMGDVLEQKFWGIGENHQPTDDASVNYKGDKY